MFQKKIFALYLFGIFIENGQIKIYILILI